MKDIKAIGVTIVLCLGFLVFWGCQGKRPSSPARIMALNVSMPVPNNLRASLLGSSTNEVIYTVGKSGTTLLKGNTGTFASSSVTGAVNFNFQVPGVNGEVLSVQLNDGTTHRPLAVGAMPLDLSAANSDVNVTLQLGSVNRNCYLLQNTTPYTSYTAGFDAFNLSLGVATSGIPYDVMFTNDPVYGGNYIVDAGGNTGGPDYNSSIAYLGNGDFVDFDFVPGPSAFTYNSWQSKYNYYYFSPVQLNFGTPTPTPVGGGLGSVPKGKAVTPATYDLEAGDVYCIALDSLPGGHAWVQVVDPGVANVSAPSIRYRVNPTLSYFQYYQTTADMAVSTCYGF